MLYEVITRIDLLPGIFEFRTGKRWQAGSDIKLLVEPVIAGRKTAAGMGIDLVTDGLEKAGQGRCQLCLGITFAVFGQKELRVVDQAARPEQSRTVSYNFV